MGWLATGLRRSLWLVLIAAGGGAVWSWRRDAADSSALGPAEWPPLSAPRPGPGTPGPGTPEAAPGESGGWADPLADGSCPIWYPVKAKDNSGIFHVPGGRFYDRTRAERCYSDATAAAADGYRQAKH